MAHVWNFSAQEEAAGRSGGEGHPQQHRELEVSLSYMRSCLKTKWELFSLCKESSICEPRVVNSGLSQG